MTIPKGISICNYNDICNLTDIQLHRLSKSELITAIKCLISVNASVIAVNSIKENLRPNPSDIEFTDSSTAKVNVPNNIVKSVSPVAICNTVIDFPKIEVVDSLPPSPDAIQNDICESNLKDSTSAKDELLDEQTANSKSLNSSPTRIDIAASSPMLVQSEESNEEQTSSKHIRFLRKRKKRIIRHKAQHVQQDCQIFTSIREKLDDADNVSPVKIDRTIDLDDSDLEKDFEHIQFKNSFDPIINEASDSQNTSVTLDDELIVPNALPSKRNFKPLKLNNRVVKALSNLSKVRQTLNQPIDSEISIHDDDDNDDDDDNSIPAMPARLKLLCRFKETCTSGYFSMDAMVRDLYEEFSKAISHDASQISLLYNDTVLQVDESIKMYGISFGDVIDCVVISNNDVFISLTIRKEGCPVVYKIRQNDKLEVIFSQFCADHHVAENSISFCFDGKRLKWSSTPSDVDLEPDDCIDVF